MQVEISNESTLRQFTADITFDVKGVEDIQRTYAETQVLRPRQVRILLAKTGNGKWRRQSVRVTGPRVLKSGKFGTTLHEEWSYDFYRAPEWLQNVIQERLDTLNAEEQVNL